MPLLPILILSLTLLIPGAQSHSGVDSIVTQLLQWRAELYESVNNHDAALRDMNTAVARTPDSPGLYIQRGQVYLNMYEWDRSLEDFNTAINLAPDDAEAYFQRGLLYYSVLQTGQTLHDEALADFRHYLDLASEGPHADQARDYIDTLEAERAALNAP